MERTKNGINLMILFFIIGIISNLIILLGFIGVVGSGEIDQGKISALGSTVCFSAIIGFVGFLVFIAALYNFIKDSSSMPTEHDTSVRIALGLYVVGFFVGFLIRPGETILYSVAAVFLVKGLGGELEKKLLWSAAGINILYGLTLSTFFMSLVKRELSRTLTLSIGIWMVVALISGYTLMIITYRRIRSKMGEDRSEKDFSDLHDWELKEKWVECPHCGMKEMVVYDDGSAECLKCGNVMMEWEGEDEE